MKFLPNFRNFQLYAFGDLVLSLWGIDMCEESQDVKAESLKATNKPTSFHPLHRGAFFQFLFQWIY